MLSPQFLIAVYIHLRYVFALLIVVDTALVDMAVSSRNAFATIFDCCLYSSQIFFRFADRG